MESQPQNPEFRNNPEKFHSCVFQIFQKVWQSLCECLSVIVE